MKIFNYEKHHEVVYVQVEDLIVIEQVIGILPQSVKEKIKDRRREDYITIDENHVVGLLKTLCWVLDYRQLKKMTLPQLTTWELQEQAELKEIEDKYFNHSELEDENKKLLKDIYIKRYLINKIHDYINHRKYNEKIAIPEKPNYEGIELRDLAGKYNVCEALQPYKYIIYRPDNKAIEPGEDVPINEIKELIATIYMLDLAQEKLDNKDSISFKTIRDVNKDYIIIEIEIIKKKSHNRKSKRK